jgi:glycosyltransferase involved in cell wall biosynthesis
LSVDATLGAAVDGNGRTTASELCSSSSVDAVRNCTAGVTVAVPNWNHELVLPRSIGSALRAAAALRGHGVPAEALVIDDASRDGSPTLLRQLESLHYGDGLRVLLLPRNIGLPAVRNLALSRASYRYVVFMDADNELVPENLYQFYRAITQTRGAAVYGNLISRRRDTGQAVVISNESFQSRMFESNYVDAFALFDRVQVQDAGGYSTSEAVKAREDWELYLHLAAAGRKIVFTPLVFGLYHDLPNSMIKCSPNEFDQAANFRRIFNQLRVRDRLPLNTRHIRYHPDVGYL